MKKTVLKIFLVVLSTICASHAFSQATLLSNNTNLTGGFVLNGKAILFSESDSLWITDGSPAGTVKLSNNVSVGDGGGVILNNKLYFSGVSPVTGAELWVTDGTTAGTVLVKDVRPGAASSEPEDFSVFNNQIYFVADDGTNGREIWKSDGTTNGTSFFKDINPGTGNGADSTTFYPLNGNLFFEGNNGTDGRELWKTDGTPGGTVQVKDITAGAENTSFLGWSFLGNSLIFSISKPGTPFGEVELWRSDGTPNGTMLLKNFGNTTLGMASFFYLFKGKLYFVAGDFTTTGDELWSTDGTANGTVLVKDINPGEDGSFAFLFNAITINDKFYFGASTEEAGFEMWVSDGTTNGTQLFMDVNPGDADGFPFFLKSYDVANNGIFGETLFNGKMFFVAETADNGQELWITDGTTAGTKMVKDINAGEEGGLESGFGSYIYSTTGLYFSASETDGNTEPWFSDGTEAGTNRIVDINNGAGGSSPEFLFIYNNQLYLSANNGDSNTNTDLFKLNNIISPLPLTLVNFMASLQQENKVQLSWATNKEINTSHFIVERSFDAKQFSAIGKVNASNGENNRYGLLDDNHKLAGNGTLYYRLKMVDKDGAFKHSSILAVQLKAKHASFTFAPNPVQQQLKVTAQTKGAKTATLRISDATGKPVYVQNLPAGQNNTVQTINVDKLPKGVYYLQLILDNEIRTEKFVKQ